MAARELLESVFAQRRATYDTTLSDDDAFEVFSADVILNSYDPSIEEIEDRIVDGGQDGGIDSVFIYVNRVLISDDTDLSGFKYPVDLELVVIQSKNELNFKENPVDKISASLPNLIRDFQKDADSQGAFKANLVDAFGLWDQVTKTLAPQFPNIKISVWYACKGNTVPPSAIAKAKTLENTIRGFMPKADATFQFAGSAELYNLAGQQKLVSAELSIGGSPLFGSNSSYIVLSSLSDYGRFISDDDDAIRASFFDANVRDYEGSVDVNKDIANSLRSPIPGIDFWWLNNGVTILATKAGFSNGKMNLQNPLIVNGLQTSYEINRCIRGGGVDNNRLVMVRIIETVDEDVINQVIKATNYQTKVRPHSLRGTEEIHRNIEIFLLSHNIYYDRRRNYYKNLGKPAARTIGIDRMAQAVTALLLEQPQVARARPTSLMKEPIYSELFPTDASSHPLQLYQVAAEMMFAVTAYMNGSKHDRIYKNNLRFHVLTALGWSLSGSQNPTPAQLGSVKIKEISGAPIAKIAEWVIAEFDKTEKTDAVAKDSEFTEQLRASWSAAGIT